MKEAREHMIKTEMQKARAEYLRRKTGRGRIGWIPGVVGGVVRIVGEHLHVVVIVVECGFS